MNYFFAYPNDPHELTHTIERAIEKINGTGDKIMSWKAMNIAGRFIEEVILEQIQDRVFVADITFLNFNVIYEIGYAIGRGQKIILVKNESFDEKEPTLLQVGIFDTIGYNTYNGAEDLVTILRKQKPNNPFTVPVQINYHAPLYIVDAKYKTDFSTRIIARVKKARLGFRSFDPNETPRLSALDAITQVAQSRGVLLSILPAHSKDSKIHNFRTAFVAGLAYGMKKLRLILQYGPDSVPIDLRDFVHSYNRLDEINTQIGTFALDVVDAMQQDEINNWKVAENHLEKINLGASAAENEMRTLKNYYLKTDAYLKAIRGEVQLVVGRKGSGKTAIFIQIRDAERNKVNNVVLDLMPEGYQLIKFKEQVLDYLEAGSVQHTITAFWEYILLLEICQKVLEMDKKRHYANKDQHEVYETLNKLYQLEDYMTEGDFSERMARLIKSISNNYRAKYHDETNVRLSDPDVTGLIYHTDIKKLRDSLSAYLNHKEKIWLLFDNVDKGWTSTGLTPADVTIIRALIDASKKIRKFFSRQKIEVLPLIFLRNDVYELLVRESSDRQKEAKVLLDWTDPDLLRQIIMLRIQTNQEIEHDNNFDALWRQICTSHYKGEDSFGYLVERSLMRPRFLLNLITHCRSFAVNLHHPKITEEDLVKGLHAYSHDLVQDIKFEIQDVFPGASGILHAFISGKVRMSIEQLNETIRKQLDQQEILGKIVELLLWYGFVGVEHKDEIKYIYSVNYDIEILKALISGKGEEAVLIINPAFWHGLLIEEN